VKSSSTILPCVPFKRVRWDAAENSDGSQYRKMDIQDPSCSNQALTMSKHFVLQANEEDTAKARSFPSGNLKMRYRQSEMAHVWVTFTIIKAINTFCNSFILIQVSK
jgi:hypothetical protein